MLTVFLLAADRELEVTLLRSGGDRAQAAADQLAGLLARSVQQRLDELARMSADAAVRNVLVVQTAATEDAARQRLATLPATGPQTIGVWNNTGERLIELNMAPAAAPRVVPAGSMPSSAGVGPLQAAGDAVFYDIVADMTADHSQAGVGETAHRVGWLVVRRSLITTPSDSLSRLVGDGALIKIGNRSDTIWTDLARVVPRPPVDFSQNQTAEYRGPDGTPRISAYARISRTPWAVVVEFPRAAILAPARKFLVGMTGIGALVLTLGWCAAYLLSRRITTPLSALAAATSAIAGGDYSQRVAADRHDEIGQLGRSFNAMAAKVDAMHRHLEARVDERTRDLDEALAQLNQRSEAQQAQLAAIVESSDDAIIGTSLDGVIQSWNAGATRLYGHSAEDVVGRSVSILTPPDGRDDVPDILTRLAAGEHIRHYDTVRMKKDGTRIQVSLTMSPIGDASGQIVGAATVARDMTERQRLEDQLRQAQKMDAIGQLAGGVAHDFNNLLTVILGLCEQLITDTPADDSRRGDLQEIQNAGISAASLTAQLLAFSRKQLIEARVLDVNAVIGEMSRMLQRIVGEDIEIRLRLAENLGRVKADPGQLHQVLMNLVVNARDAMPSGGQLTIETDNIDFDHTHANRHFSVVPGAYVMLAVSDAGTGMTPEVQAKLFEPFFTTKEQGKGTGLGLASVYGIVKQSEGNISVYSEVGRGTTFKIYLPRIADTAERMTPAPAMTLAPGVGTILVVDDNPGLQALTSRLLRNHGYVVLVAGSASEALHICATHDGPIDLLLTDVVMPGQSGPSLAKDLTLEQVGMAVLYMSGYAADAIVRGGLLEHTTAFLQKPFSRDALLRKVQSVLAIVPE